MDTFSRKMENCYFKKYKMALSLMLLKSSEEYIILLTCPSSNNFIFIKLYIKTHYIWYVLSFSYIGPNIFLDIFLSNTLNFFSCAFCGNQYSCTEKWIIHNIYLVYAYCSAMEWVPTVQSVANFIITRALNQHYEEISLLQNSVICSIVYELSKGI